MTPQEIQSLKALIVATSAYYGHTVPDNVLALYVEDLADLEFPAVAGAIKEVRRDPKTTRFPLPAAIRSRIAPTESVEDQAREAASRITSAVAKYGWTNPERAKEFIGEVGWYVVDRMGGWQNVCQTLCAENMPSLQAQWRELAASAMRRSKAGTLNVAPALPKPESGSLERLLPDPLKSIPRLED